MVSEPPLITPAKKVKTVTKTILATFIKSKPIIESKKVDVVETPTTLIKEQPGMFKQHFAVFMSSLASAFISFQIGAFYAKHEIMPKYLENKQQVFALQQQIVETKTEIKKVVEEKQELVAETVAVKKATVGLVKKYYLQLIHPDGTYELRTGGNSSWRYNNPGKLLYGNFAKLNGAIGRDGPLAIFSTYDDGYEALSAYIFESDFGFKNATIKDAIEKLAPPSDGYDTKSYLKYVLSETGLKETKKLDTMDIDVRAKFLDAIQYQESFTAGNIIKFANKAEFEKKGY